MDGEKAKTVPASSLVQNFACTSCGAPVTIRAVGHSLAVVCPSCHAVIDAQDPNYKILSEASTKLDAFEPLIPLGERGTLFDVKYEMIGFMVRTDSSGDYPWQEYLLFN